MRRGWRKILLWLVLALPATAMIVGVTRGTVLAMDMLHPTGEFAVRLMILAMLPGPLSEIMRPGRFLRGWMAIRRNLGVAAFGYAMLHLIFYLADMQGVAAILDELTLPSILTGWIALAAMAVPAAISFDRAMRAMKRNWQRWQYLVYPAFLVGLLHWVLLDWHWQPALIHLMPLAIVWLLRGVHRRRAILIRKGAIA